MREVIFYPDGRKTNYYESTCKTCGCFVGFVTVVVGFCCCCCLFFVFGFFCLFVCFLVFFFGGGGVG